MFWNILGFILGITTFTISVIQFFKLRKKYAN